MSLTRSKSISLGKKIQNFNLLDPISNKKINLKSLISEKATVIMFICNHCPFVKHINQQLVILAKDYIPKKVSFIAINSNDVENYPEDSPKKMKEYAKKLKYPFLYLFDETQTVAKKYEAVCTPDFFIFDKEKKLVYHGQLDDSRPGNNIPVTGIDIRNALDLLLDNRKISKEQKLSIGCNIKWKIPKNKKV